MPCCASMSGSILPRAKDATPRQSAFPSYNRAGICVVLSPDANFPNAEYQRTVKIGGPGPADHPAADHKLVYDHTLFVDVFRRAGFDVDLLEYCDNDGRFHYNQWNPDEGPIYRSLRSDHRNRGSELGFVSLIIDARKPK